MTAFQQAAHRGIVSPVELQVLADAISNICQMPIQQHTPRTEPDAVVAIRRQIRHLKQKEALLYADIKEYATVTNPEQHKETLFDLACEMLELQNALDEAVSDIRLWEQKGVLPVAGKEQLVKEVVAKMVMLENHRKAIGRIKKQIEQAGSEADTQKFQQQLEEKTQQLADLKKELGV